MTSSSLDVLDLVDPDVPQLLAESLPSLSSIPSESYLAVPPFPIRPIKPMSPLLASSDSPEHLSITTSIATLPRFSKQIHEPVRVTLWLSEISPSDPPGDIPWGGVRPTKPAENWYPEGSLFSPHQFYHALRSARRNPRNRPSASLQSNPASHHNPSYREALVFKRDITLNADGNPKRWSLQVPATTMHPDVVDMMLELQDLNSFFKDGLQDLDQSVAALDHQNLKILPPSLVVSDSHNALPLLLDPSTHLTNDPSVTLAARRGKDLLPPLFITTPSHHIATNSYPSIPSAFMGSPSAYSPNLECIAPHDKSSLGLEDMIATLKSKCRYPQPPADEDSQVVDSPVSAMSFASPSEQIDSEDDDWAFAVSLLTEFGSQPSEIIGKMDLSSHSPQNEQLPTGSNLLSAGEVLTSSSITTTLQNTAGSLRSPPSPVPPAPLPLTPPSTPADRPSSPKGVRSILKSCKNVRFASLPEKPDHSEVKPLVLKPPSPPLVHSPPSHLRRPLRTRTIYRASKMVGENKQSISSGSYLPTPPNSHVIPKLDKTGTSLPPSPADQSFSKSPSPLSRTVSPLRPTLSARHSASVTSARKSISLGRAVKSSDADKENNPPKAASSASTPRATTTSRWTMNDMTFRRGSNISQPNPDGTPRSRMPVPLRNILTRFK